MAIIAGTDNSETLTGTPDADTISGLGGDDTLRGLASADMLDGGIGNDTMFGGGGWDIYHVDSVGDRITEGFQEGRDEVRTTLASYTLGANLEDLTHIGTANFGGTGNSQNNIITGGSGNDTLEGGAGNDELCGLDGNDFLDGGVGNDTMVGGRGSDVYQVGSVGDRVVEGNRGGTDEVRTTLTSYALGPNVENLTFTGTGAFSGTGNALRNIITGGTFNDTLTGAGGNDRLFGGDGNDTAVFAGKRADYTITTVGSITTVVDNNAADGNDGTDTLDSFERLKFADEVVIIGGAAKDLADLDGTNGFSLVGIDAFDGSGISVSSAGDVNGDGFDDLLVGANGAESTPGEDYQGESYVVFGKASWAGVPALDLGTLDGTNGFRLIGVDTYDLAGTSVSSAGDINGDGFADIIVAAPAAGVNGEGESYVVFGKASWAGTPAIELATLNGTNGFRLVGSDAYDQSGRSVSSAGDVNGDGLDDLIVGASDAADYTGESYVVFGKASWAGTPSFDLATLNGTNGFTLVGSLNGYAVSSAGDVNGDGFDDLIVGTPGVGSFVVFGKASWAGTPALELATLDGTNGFRITEVDKYDNGRSVSSAGDVNGDGFADLILGASQAEDTAASYDEGESYVVFGKASWVGTPSFDLATLDGTNGFRLIGIDKEDFSGRSVSSAGDVNGDGFDDVIIGASDAESTAFPLVGEGESYVVFGKASWAGTPSLDLATLDGTNGFRLIGIDPGDSSGWSVSSAGDVNGDGFDDLIVGAIGAESELGADNEGESYVVFGGNFTGAVTHLGTAGNDTLAGTAASESFVGGLGDDIMNSGGGADAFQGGAGNDTIGLVSASFFHIDGGNGTDTIALNGAGLTLDLTTILPASIESIERIDITGTGANAVRLTIGDVLDISDDSNSLLVAGNAGDSADIGAGWTKAATGGSNGNGTSTIAGQTYQHFNAGQASLLVDTDIGVLTS